MPTGFTAPIYEGKPITRDEYLLRVAHGMAPAYRQRDEPLDAPLREIPVSDYYVNRLRDADFALAEAEARTDDQWELAQLDAIQDASAANEDYLARKENLRARYLDMIREVEAWEPPTPEHQGLKDYAIRQLRDSIDFDAPESKGYDAPKPPLPVAEYRENELRVLREEVAQAREAMAKEVANVAASNQWVRELNGALNV